MWLYENVAFEKIKKHLGKLECRKGEAEIVFNEFTRALFDPKSQHHNKKFTIQRRLSEKAESQRRNVERSKVRRRKSDPLGLSKTHIATKRSFNCEKCNIQEENAELNIAPECINCNANPPAGIHQASVSYFLNGNVAELTGVVTLPSFSSGENPNVDLSNLALSTQLKSVAHGDECCDTICQQAGHDADIILVPEPVLTVGPNVGICLDLRTPLHPLTGNLRQQLHEVS